MLPTVLAVIPLRLASTRLPEKIFLKIGTRTLAERSVERAIKAFEKMPFVRLLVAVDDLKTETLLRRRFKTLQIVMTSPELASGTDRVFGAVQAHIAAHPELQESVKGVLNIQGDMPFMALEGVRQAALFYNEASVGDLKRAGMITLAQDWPHDVSLADQSSVKVITDREDFALYFSRYPIPYSRVEPVNPKKTKPTCFLHIGLYGYTLESLTRFCAQPPVALELQEGLEQLRAMWLGIPILVMTTTLKSGESFRGIDSRQDLLWARRFVK